jgi:hypothetical protein
MRRLVGYPVFEVLLITILLIGAIEGALRALLISLR